MSESVATTHAEHLSGKVKLAIGHLLRGEPTSGYLLLGAGTRTTLGDELKAFIPLIGSKQAVTTDLVVHTSYQGSRDYLPNIHVMLSGGIKDDVFVPTRMEYGTFLDCGVPNHLSVSSGKMEPASNPLVHLLRVDERFQRFLNAVPQEHEVERRAGLGREKLTLHADCRGEVFSVGEKTYAGLHFLPNLRGELGDAEGKSTGMKAKSWGYQLEPVVFEVFARLAYYTNYLAYPMKTPSTLRQSKLLLPHILEGEKRKKGG